MLKTGTDGHAKHQDWRYMLVHSSLLLEALDFFLSGSLCASSNSLLASSPTCMLSKVLRKSTRLRSDGIEQVDRAGALCSVRCDPSLHWA